jgi:hypothetical protein
MIHVVSELKKVVIAIVPSEGVWIEDWSYQPPSGGTLRYTVSSILDDNDSSRAHVVYDRVTVLGLRAATGGKNVTGGNGVAGPIPRPPLKKKS